MKRLSKYLLTILVVLFYLLTTADSIIGKDTQYGEIEYDPQTAPVLSLTLRNIFDGKQPYLVVLAKNMISPVSEQLVQSPDNEEQTENPEISDDNDQEQRSENPEQTDAMQAEAETEPQPVGEQPVESQPEEVQPVEVQTPEGEQSLEEIQAQQDVPSEAENPEAVEGEQPADAPVENQEQPAEEPVQEEPVPEPPVYQIASVEDDYFCDALFIGDSRTVGLSEYCQELMDRSTFYAKISLTIYDFDKKAFIKLDEESEKITIAQALEQKKFGKIYIMLGLNELGGGTPETFGEAYAEVVNRIRELQPDAQIYIQGIMHVTAAKSNNDRVFKNDTINERNQVIAQLADNQHVFYIDMNEATDDEEGALTQDLSFDNVHLKAKSYALWYDYLKNHAYVINNNAMTE